MKLTIDAKKDNLLLQRWEIQGTVAFDQGTPSNDAITAEVAQTLGQEVGLVVIKHIYTLFGQRSANFSAVVYKTEQAKTSIERKVKTKEKKGEK